MKILQLFFISGIAFFFGLIIYFLRKKMLALKNTLPWFFLAFLMLLFSVFPDLLMPIASLIGFEVASNAIFSLLFAFIVIILLQHTSAVSQQNDMIKTLAQLNALLEKRVRELEKNEI